MPNTQFIILLIITVFSLLAGIVSAVVLFGQLNAKKRERAELERRLENTVGAAMNSSVGNASAELERRLQDRTHFIDTTNKQRMIMNDLKML